MKLRIKGNSLRFRLTKSDINKLGAEGYLEENTAFVSNVFSYALQSRPDEYGHELSADFKDAVITIYIPEKMLEEWIQTERVGFDTQMLVDNGERLYLLVEKDFKCLDETVEDQNDNYDNPLMNN